MFHSSLTLLQSGRSRGQKPDEERCLKEGSSDRNSSESESSDVGSYVKHKPYDARNVSRSSRILFNRREILREMAVNGRNGQRTSVVAPEDALKEVMIP